MSKQLLPKNIIKNFLIRNKLLDIYIYIYREFARDLL